MDRTEAIRAIREKSWVTYARVAQLVDETDATLIEHFIRAGRMGDGILTDPIESDPVAGPIIQKARDDAMQTLKRERGGEHVWPPAVDELAQQILKNDHDIDWKTLQQMNPDIHFNYA